MSTCSRSDQLSAFRPRDPSVPFHHTGGAFGWTYADPFEETVPAWDDSDPRLVDSRPSVAWDTGEVDASCEDGLPSGDHHTVPRTVAEVDQPVASAVAETVHAVGAAGGRPDLERSSSEEPCEVACLESSHDIAGGGTEVVWPSSAEQDDSLDSASSWQQQRRQWQGSAVALEPCSSGHTDCPSEQNCEASCREEAGHLAVL